MCADGLEGDQRRSQLDSETLAFSKNIQARAMQKKKEKAAEQKANEGGIFFLHSLNSTFYIFHILNSEDI
jgi:hypothetical protein